MGDDIDHQLAIGLSSAIGVHQQQVLSEGDAPQVLHRPGREIRQRDEVDLLPGVIDAVVLAEPPQAERRGLESEAGEMPLAGCVHHPHRCAVDIDRLGRLEWADHKGDEIRAHHHRVGETHLDASGVAVVDCPTRDLRRIRDRRQAVSDDEGDREHRLELGLVEARKRPPAVGRLHLGRRDHPFNPVGVDEG